MAKPTRRTGTSARFTNLIPIRVDEKLLDRIKTAAAESNLTVSAYCRMILGNSVPHRH